MDFSETYGMSFADFVLNFAALDKGVAKIAIVGDKEQSSTHQTCIALESELAQKTYWPDDLWKAFFDQRDQRVVNNYIDQLEKRLKNLQRIIKFRSGLYNWNPPESYRALRAHLEAFLDECQEENFQPITLELDTNSYSARKRAYLADLQLRTQVARSNWNRQFAEIGAANVWAKELMRSLGVKFTDPRAPSPPE